MPDPMILKAVLDALLPEPSLLPCGHVNAPRDPHGFAWCEDCQSHLPVAR